MDNNELIIFYVDDLNNRRISTFSENPYKELNDFLNQYGEIYQKIRYCFRKSLDIKNRKILVSKFITERKSHYIETEYEKFDNLPKELFKELMKD